MDQEVAGLCQINFLCSCIDHDFMIPGNICVYCPGGPDSDFEYSTQSYTGYEPTSMRAIRARYNPYVQARARVEQLRRLGHSVDKVSLSCFALGSSMF